jgi:hypothetical protein
MKTTIELIHHIASNPHYTTIEIECDDKTPMQAIEFLSSHSAEKIWSINSSLKKDTLLVFDYSDFFIIEK